MNGPILQCAIDVARLAGSIQQRFRSEHGTVHIQDKGDTDIVTAVDTACESAIIDLISSRFPDHGILAEEGGARRLSARCVWIIDPLDGTKNYAHGSVRCGVSIGVQLDGDTVVGVIYAPFLDELFTATQDGGARCNDTLISVSSNHDLHACLIATALTFEKGSRKADRTQLARILRMFSTAQAVRSNGCAALDMADVARGRIDAYFEPGLAPWDTAAGALLVAEAGGHVTTFDGHPHLPGAPSIITSNGLIHAALREHLSAAVQP